MLKQPWARFVPDLVFWIVYIMPVRYRIGARLKISIVLRFNPFTETIPNLTMIGNIKSEEPVTFERSRAVSSQFPGKFKIVEINAHFLVGLLSGLLFI